MLKTALALAKKDIYVLPVIYKQPLLKYREATNSAEQINKIWQEYPSANVAILLEPSRLLAVDVDNKNGKSGNESIKNSSYDLPETVSYATPNAGAHFLYLAPRGKFCTRLDSLSGVDLKGGKALLNFYGNEENLNTPIAPAPKWLIERLRFRDTPRQDRGILWRRRTAQLNPLDLFASDGMSHNDLVSGARLLVLHNADDEEVEAARSIYSDSWGARGSRDFENAYNWALRTI